MAPPVPLLRSTLLLVLLAACGQQPQAAAVQAEIDPPIRHDFGILPLGTRRTQDLEIPVPGNEHGAVIVADNFQGSCTCAIGMVMIVAANGTSRAVYGLPEDQRTIQPGDRVILRLTLDTKDLEPVDVPRTRSIGSLRFTLTSAEWARYETRYIEFHYGVRTPIKVAPVAHVDFGHLPLCRRHEQTLELSSNLPGVAMQLGAVTATHDFITARLEPRGDRQLLHVTVTPHREQERQIRGGIAIPTGRDDYPFLRIGVSGTFVGDIEYMPSETLDFGLFAFGETRERFVNLLDHDLSRPPEFAVRSLLDANGNDISAHFEVAFQRLSGRKVRVTVKYLGTLGGIRMAGELSLAKAKDGPPVARLIVSGYNSKR